VGFYKDFRGKTEGEQIEKIHKKSPFWPLEAPYFLKSVFSYTVPWVYIDRNMF